LIVSELLTNLARHARFDDRNPEAEVKLLLAGNFVRCAVSDNGSASDLIVRGRGLTIVGELSSSLGGRVHASCAAEGASFLLTFPLTESEQRGAGATHVVLKRRKVRRSRRLQVPRAEDAAAG
jgi:two-component sensor histidine kinase